MPLSAQDWHKRFTQQARWTQALRAHLYPRVGLSKAERILDIGCGTGALLWELQSSSAALVLGVDVLRAHLELAQINQGVLLSQGDAHQLPIANDIFDITLCHFTLMWVYNPVGVLHEMVRVTKPGAAILALAEPDYGGRIDYPADLEQMGQWQIDSLRAQGADPFMGRKLSGLFYQAGLTNIETGVLGAQWADSLSSAELEIEWGVLKSDTDHTFMDPETLNDFIENDKLAREQGQRVLFVPTFYAFGWKN